jgi:hypothetical protein
VTIIGLEVLHEREAHALDRPSFHLASHLERVGDPPNVLACVDLDHLD